MTIRATKINDLLDGSFKNEAVFKKALIQKLLAKKRNLSIYEIENPEKEPGMPDVLVMSMDEPAVLIETKFIRKDGRVKFQPSQPLWYMKNKNVYVFVIAWDSRSNTPVLLLTPDILRAKALSIAVDKKYAAEIDFVELVGGFGLA